MQESAKILALLEEIQVSLMEQDNTVEKLDAALSDQQLQLSNMETKLLNMEAQLRDIGSGTTPASASAQEKPPHY